jgi:hypothetical protein
MRRSLREVEVSEYIRFMRRITRAAGARVAAADPDDLLELIALRDDLDVAIAAAVAGLREAGATWDDIGRATGTSRQAAFKKWAHSATTG